MADMPKLPISQTASLGLALVISSNTPLVLLDSELTVLAASRSFCHAFGLEIGAVTGHSLLAMGAGEWNRPQLRSLLHATVTGNASIDAYEFELARPGEKTRCLIINAHLLDYSDGLPVRVVMAILDITDARQTELENKSLVREKQVLLKELQHRIANSLQIIASVLMQGARKVQSEEARLHLKDAHHRVMSIATLQRQLAASKVGEVELRDYFTELCASIAASMIPDADVVALNVTVDGSHTSSEISVSLGLIVTELVINALKHGFPDGRAGTITVDYRADGKKWALSITDDGVGMPTGDTPAHPGLGTSIVEALVRKLRASVVVSDANPGTSVRVSNDDVVNRPEAEAPLLVAV